MDSVESICNSLARCKVLDVETVRTLRGLWREQNKDRGDQPAEFKRWLVQTGYVTEFQLDMLGRGLGDHLILDEYKLLDRLARGRHAGVFQAVHSSGQKAAIKVLPPSRSRNPQVLARFLREARLATRLDHDNIVRTFHHGKTADGTHFIVMEFLEGETIEELLQRRKRLPAAEAVRLILQGLEGLQYLDEMSVIHRDIKPANLMLVPTDASAAGGSGAETTVNRTLKILDIGLSRALFDENEDNVDLTKEGTLLGTMNYMAPEQARDAHAADVRSDIYSLGCVLYEMLVGEPPFADKNLARQLRRHAEEKPRSMTQLAPGIPDVLDSVVQKMLAKDPAMRHLTPGQAIKDLRQVLTILGSQGTGGKPSRPLKTFMTWLETKRQADEVGTQAAAAPVAVEAGPGKTPTRVASAAAGQTKVAAPAGPSATIMAGPAPPAVPGQPAAAPARVPTAIAAGQPPVAVTDKQPAPVVPMTVLAVPTTATGPAMTVLVPEMSEPAAEPTAAPAAPSNAASPPPADAPGKDNTAALKAVLAKSWDVIKRWSWNFAVAVRNLTAREWALIGIGAVLSLALQGLWSLFR